MGDEIPVRPDFQVEFRRNVVVDVDSVEPQRRVFGIVVEIDAPHGEIVEQRERVVDGRLVRREVAGEAQDAGRGGRRPVEERDRAAREGAAVVRSEEHDAEDVFCRGVLPERTHIADEVPREATGTFFAGPQDAPCRRIERFKIEPTLRRFRDSGPDGGERVGENRTRRGVRGGVFGTRRRGDKGEEGEEGEAFHCGRGRGQC